MGSSHSQNAGTQDEKTDWEFHAEDGVYHSDFFEWKEGAKLFFRHIQRTDPQCVVFLFHGLAVSGYHQRELVTHLVDQLPVEVFAMDQVNHGRSVVGRPMDIRQGDVLWKSQTDFLRHMLEVHQDRLKGVPVFALGDSMGGATAFFVGLAAKDVLTGGVVFTSPALMIPNPPNKCTRGLIRSLKAMMPNAKAASQRTDAITRDAAKLEILLNQPYKINGPITFRTGVALFDMSLEIQQRMEEFSVPFLICHGTMDGYTDIEGSRALFAKANVPEEHRCLKEYEGAFHDLLHELDPTVDAFLGDIVNWITVRLDQMRAERQSQEVEAV